MEKKIYKYRSIFLILNLLFIIFTTILFSSCSQRKEKDDVRVWATVYHIKIPSFNPPWGEIKVNNQINIIYVIKSNRLLTDNDILVEKTGSQSDTLKLVCTDTVCYDKAKAIPRLAYSRVLICTDTTIIDLENQSEYFYECYSNKYLDVDYIWSSSQKNDYKEYYHKVSDVIKNTDLIFNGDTLQKSYMYNEYFWADQGYAIDLITIWNCKDW